MRVRVIILARAPYMGSVKTRLAKTLGVVQATKLYRQMLNRAIEAASEHESYIAWTPDNTFFYQSLFALPALQQGGGDLGERLERLAKLHAPVIFLGSDSLAITKKAIDEAVRALRWNDVVIAPSGDGGYSLIGLRSGALPVFKSIRWSHEKTLEDSLAQVRHKRVHLLPELPDIDEADDLLNSLI